ncbi:hypothetical protein GSI_08877 [Ganoderma sinense ZZ0214-1]|uniref:Uncharacterized protein n=1 Tax=Ganoderma sinense ZZ0214-1 TaxID=1077348 RepID=A0A2G8S4Y5_9APHY|nr:hypothetical protein GSI_08877 [Ganoderma sinense ZZ0214-1]
MLRARPVVLRKIATILKFHDFVFSDADAHARMPQIVALVIHVTDYEYDTDPEPAIQALLAILKRTRCLVSLELSSSANGSPLGYLDDPRLSAAVGELFSLRELTIYGRTQVADFISPVRSPLTKLALSCFNPLGALDEWTPSSPLTAALFRFAPSLETLTIQGSSILLPNGPPGSRLPAFTHFHAVRSLTLNSLVALPYLPILLDLFPNLDGTMHLITRIQPSFHFASLSLAERYDLLRRAREENGVAQERRRWKRLERLVCDVETLFVLNLRCPIGLTIVHGFPANADWVNRRCLVESLRDHPPTRLNLQAKGWCGSGDPELGGLIPPEAAATLTHLTLRASYLYFNGVDHPRVRWDDLWRDGLLPAIAALHALTHFRLIFHLEAGEGAVPVSPIAEDALVEDLRPTSRSRGRFNFAAAASVMADALPSLRYCFMTNSARVSKMEDFSIRLVEEWCESRAWRVGCVPLGSNDGDGGTTTVDTRGAGRELVELHDDVAETIIRREDLVLSTEEKASAVERRSFGGALR